jgi:two-component SAPR family response regulator
LRLLLVTAALLPALAVAQSNAPEPASRGQLLYDTHCIACHNEQVHWRERKLATDWPSLVNEVRRWQVAGRLQWSEADVEQVARHLNETIYRYATPLRAAAIASRSTDTSPM